MQPPNGSRSFEAAISVAGYAALMAAWVYGVANTSARLGHEDLFGALELVYLVALHLGLGVAIGRFWVLLAYPLAVFVAVPAGRPPWLYHDPSPPIWNVLLVMSPFALSLIALGIGLRRFGADRKLGQRLASSPKG